ncbi:ribosomal protein S7 [Choiromyces venosus 120613-1]|uniref:Ribosomal protein S7 n=1 Tax=Choiromyces venosus 120613-1 TaxID=1336337 RepID=A0A3N4K0A1_9PEZI|nr:ribosomal protein S7 [Choiromyces venosus 120613-1]
MPPRTIFIRPYTLRILPRYTSLTPRLNLALIRNFTSKDTPPPIPSKPLGPNQDVLPHVSEEAAITADIMGGESPALEQGTPIGEMVKKDPAAQKNAPKVLKDIPGTKRQYSTSTTPIEPSPSDIPADIVSSTALTSPSVSSDDFAMTIPGAKYPLPQLPLPSCSHLKHRYSTLLEQVINFVMIGGRKAKAESLVDQILANLRTRPAPKPREGTPLLPGTPALSTLPLDPVQYLQTAIDSVSPLVKISMLKGAGGTKQPVPYPLRLRQRRRFALTWISAAADKKKDRLGFAERFADEVLAVVEGKSSAWEKRSQVHKLAVVSRANVIVNPGRTVAPSKIKFPVAVL